ncbi:MAG TPA: hypothetical protein VKV26_21810 [Dehalococcoidia bacterium]|nr:hypothetical protein [Dehalococcoidia bacterium]
MPTANPPASARQAAAWRAVWDRLLAPIPDQTSAPGGATNTTEGDGQKPESADYVRE